jgi:hypothetical protein
MVGTNIAAFRSTEDCKNTISEKSGDFSAPTMEV